MIKFLFLIFLLCTLLSYSHEGESAYVHQRIVYEAYKLLKLQFSKESGGFADIDQFLGNIEWYNIHYWDDVNTLLGGSGHEDHEDIVYHYKGIPIDFNDHKYSHITITHFWDADNPNGKMKLYLHETFPSAVTKAFKYINDDWEKIIKEPCGLGETVCYHEYHCPRKDGTFLFDWYWKDKVWVEKSFFKDVWGRQYSYNYYKTEWNNLKCKQIFFNILGRICHLLTDMGVPEHARRSMHISDWHSPFEDWLADRYDENEFFWTAEKVYKERGGFVNPFCPSINDQFRAPYNLFYTLAQLSDWFVTRGSLPYNGNNNYNENIGEIKSIIDSYAPSEDYFRVLPSNYSSGWHIGDNEGRKFRDVLLPYTIRAVAGLLYKYIIETRMQFPNATNEPMGMIFDQQQELNLFNQYINGDYYTFRAEGDPGLITVCPVTRPAGILADFKIDKDALNVTFRAAKEINFKSGFSAISGSQVHAYICPDCSRTSRNGNCHECGDEDKNPQYDRSN
jgi:hypothetical protein